MLKMCRASSVRVTPRPRNAGHRRPAAASFALSLPHWPHLPARHLQFFHLGKLPVMDSAEAYQPDTRLRLGMGVKATGVGGKAPTAGALKPEPVLVCVGWP